MASRIVNVNAEIVKPIEPVEIFRALIGAATVMLDHVAERYGVKLRSDFKCPRYRKTAEILGWQRHSVVAPLRNFFNPLEVDKHDVDLPFGLIRYLGEALKLRQEPILARKGRPVYRTWVEITVALEKRGYGKMSHRKLARALKNFQGS